MIVYRTSQIRYFPNFFQLIKSFSSNQVLLKLIKEWKKPLDDKILLELHLWTCLKRLTAFLTTCLLQNVMFMVSLWIQ